MKRILPLCSLLFSVGLFAEGVGLPESLIGKNVLVLEQAAKEKGVIEAYYDNGQYKIRLGKDGPERFLLRKDFILEADEVSGFKVGSSVAFEFTDREGPHHRLGTIKRVYENGDVMVQYYLAARYYMFNRRRQDDFGGSAVHTPTHDRLLQAGTYVKAIPQLKLNRTLYVERKNVTFPAAKRSAFMSGLELADLGKEKLIIVSTGRSFNYTDRPNYGILRVANSDLFLSATKSGKFNLYDSVLVDLVGNTKPTDGKIVKILVNHVSPSDIWMLVNASVKGYFAEYRETWKRPHELALKVAPAQK